MELDWRRDWDRMVKDMTAERQRIRAEIDRLEHMDAALAAEIKAYER